MNKKIVKINNLEVGTEKIVLIAGPCAVESEQEFELDVKNLKAVDIFRGGAYKTRTSPHSFSGLGEKGIEILNKISKKYNKPFVTEITKVDLIPTYEKLVDIIQVGARSMQNFELLKALGKTNKPILLKRGFGNTIEELIYAAEYISSEGNDNIILCERGIRTFESSTRFTLDVSAIPVLKSKTPYPVIVDPSHAAGDSAYVEALTLAAIAAGADGIMIEIHSKPDQALSDKKQALKPEKYNEIILKAEKVAKAIGRYI